MNKHTHLKSLSVISTIMLLITAITGYQPEEKETFQKTAELQSTENIQRQFTSSTVHQFVDMSAPQPIRTQYQLLNNVKEQNEINASSSPYQVNTSFGSFDEKEITNWITRYPKKQWSRQLERSLSNGKFYESFIRERIDHYGLPQELYYLPVIESRYINNAQSWVGAMGIWQFMSQSATPYGLQINSNRDERKDFMLATDAALKKLRYNYRETGDWLLALSAYNCGLGCVKRAVKRSGLNDFWALNKAGLLPDETLDYIPKLLAVIYIASNDDYDIDPKGNRYRWTQIELKKSINLRHFSKETGISYAILKQANAELPGDITPLDNSPYFLKIPDTFEEKARSILEKKA